MKLPVFKPSKAWLVLGVALVIGGLAFLGAKSFLANRLAAIESRSQGKTVSVVVAQRDLHKGDVLSKDNVAVRAVPMDYAQSNAVAPEQFDTIEGEAIAVDLRSGEMLMWSQMESKKVPTFSARVESGRRAITVAVDEINSISGLLEPGDFIDLLVTFSQGSNKITAPLLEDVQVLATGQRSVDDPRSGQSFTYSTVTLDTTWQEAQNVVVGREQGRLTALLRNPDDKAPVPGVITDLASLLSRSRNVKDAPSVEGIRQVPVMYGGAGGNGIPPEALRLGQYVMSKPGSTGNPVANAAALFGSLQELRQMSGSLVPDAAGDDLPTPASSDSGELTQIVPVLSASEGLDR